MGAIVKAVAEAMKLRPREIRRGSGGLARKVAVWLGVYEGRRRLRVIARTLHLNSCSRITQLAAECDRLLRSDKSLEQLVSAARLCLG